MDRTEGALVYVRLGAEEHALSWEDFEARVRSGRIPPDTMVRIAAVTGTAYVPARELELFRSMRNEAALAYEGRFLAGSPPIATAVLVGLQIRVWWFARVPPIQELLVGLGVNFTPAVLDDGQIWRPLSMGLLHTDTLHICLNMMWLAYVGWNLERALGWANLVTLYGASVLGGAVLSMFVSPFTPSLGASGGVFGLIAASVVYGFIRRDSVPLRGQRWFGIAMLPYLVLMFLSGWANEQTDNWAHMGGLVTGMLLGFVVEPDELSATPGRPRKVRLAVGIAGLCVLLGLWGLGPRLHPLYDSETARLLSRPWQEQVVARRRPPPPPRPLRFAVPGGWRPGSDVLGTPAFVSPDGKRAFSAVERGQDRARPLPDVAMAWVDDLHKDFPEAEVGEPVSVELAGREGLMLQATVGEGKDRRMLSWWGTNRGTQELSVTWQVEPVSARKLAPLRDRLVASVSRSEPPELVAARNAQKGNPRSPKARAALATELARIGEADEALALHEALVTEAPAQADRWVAYLGSLGLLGHLAPAPDPVIERALAATPAPTVVVAAADLLQATGRDELAQGLLSLAWWQTPGDKALKRARVRRDLPIQLYGTDPWELVHDPLGAPRDPAEIARRMAWKLTLADAELAAQALAADRKASIAAAVEGISEGSQAAVVPLLILRGGAVPDELSDARAALADDLERTAKGTGPDWVPVEVAAALTENPAYPQAIQPKTPAPAP
jgi:membrane associated rhomboid family serine protease